LPLFTEVTRREILRKSRVRDSPKYCSSEAQGTVEWNIDH
jgi:hypothetical protein